MIRWSDVIIAFLVAPWWGLFWSVVGIPAGRAKSRLLRYFRNTRPFLTELVLIWIAAACLGIIYGSLRHGWAWMSGSAASLITALAIRWWRKNRTRVKALAGAKSRAIRDAMVARMPKPRTVLQGS